MDVVGPTREDLLREQRNVNTARLLDMEIEASELRLRVHALEAKCAELEAQLAEALSARVTLRTRIGERK